MGTRNVINCLFLLLFSSIGIGQEKYLYYNQDRDSTIEIDGTIYYKIEDNLFDKSRYAQVDTLSSKQLSCLEISTVKELWEEAKESRKKLIEDIEEGKPIPTIDTYNLIFEHIYVLEEISKWKYKRTRVWWIDY